MWTPRLPSPPRTMYTYSTLQCLVPSPHHHSTGGERGGGGVRLRSACRSRCRARSTLCFSQKAPSCRPCHDRKFFHQKFSHQKFCHSKLAKTGSPFCPGRIFLHGCSTTLSWPPRPPLCSLVPTLHTPPLLYSHRAFGDTVSCCARNTESPFCLVESNR